MIWTNKYIGIPFEHHGRSAGGIDCAGLAIMVYKAELGITIPDCPFRYDKYMFTKARRELSEYMTNGMNCFIEVKTPREFDVIKFGFGGIPYHVGVYAGKGRFIHSREGAHVSIEQLASPKWSKRIVGYYRHEDRIQSSSIART